jgi:hypothetical protein
MTLHPGKSGRQRRISLSERRARLEARRTRDEARQAMFDVGYFLPNTPPGPELRGALTATVVF